MAIKREALRGISRTELTPAKVASGSLVDRGENSDALLLLVDQYERPATAVILPTITANVFWSMTRLPLRAQRRS